VDIGNIQVVTSDNYASTYTFTPIPSVQNVSNSLRSSIGKGRKKNNVREFDLYNM
jgi:hypothetical protein